MTNTETLNDVRAQSIVERIEWYVNCLHDYSNRVVVRGLGEAFAGYESALREIKEAARG